MVEHIAKNPWLGLQSYKEGEILYGRDEDIRDLTQSVLNDTDTLLYGKSGIGKSSILNAGVIPAMKRNDFIPVVVRLSHKKSHSYLKQVQYAIEDTLAPIPIDSDGTPIELTTEDEKERKALLSKLIVEKVKCMNDQKETFYEYFHRHEFRDTNNKRIKFLLIFDQFEEIFTLQTEDKIRRDFFNQIADVLNDVFPSYLQQDTKSSSKKQKIIDLSNDSNFDELFSNINLENEDDIQEYVNDNDIHFIFTIREDFLSDFEYYSATIPSLKHNRYGLRPINEEQAAQIIRRPIPGLVDLDVTELIIRKVTGRSDFKLDGVPEIDVDSAVLSLYLNRLYEASNGQPFTSKLVEEKGGEIISNFYNDSIKGISEKSIEYLEDMLLNGNGRRDNITIFDAKDEGGLTDEEIRILCDERKVLRQFNYAGELRIELVHDILCPIVKEHKEQREQDRLKEEERKRIEEETKKLQEEAERKQREIEEKAAREKAEMEEEVRKTKIRNHRIYAVIASVFLFALLGGTYYYFANLYTYKSYYKEFTRIDGWPVGIGNQLSEVERASTPLYYCLSHKGCKSPILRIFGIVDENGKNTDVEILSSNAKLPHRPRVASLETADATSQDDKAVAYNELLSNICKIHFVEGENNTIEKEVAFNDKDSILFVINYFHINHTEMWSSFFSPSGQAMQIRENGIDRTKISLDSLGRVRSMMYYDQNGVIQPIHDGVYGYAWEFGTENNEEKRYILNQFSLPIDNGYNMVVTELSGDTTVTRYRHVMSTDDKMGVETIGPEGFCLTKKIGDKALMYISESAKEYSTKTTTRDAKGNILKEEIANNPSPRVPTITNFKYDNDGNLIRMEKLISANVPFVVNEKDDYLYEWKYKDGKKVSEIRRNKTQITYLHIIETKNNVTREVLEDVYTGKYLVKVDSTFKDGYSTSYFGRNNQPINHKVCLEEDSITFHRKRCVVHDNDELRYFYVFDETEKKAPLILDEYGKATSYFCKEIKKNNEGLIIAYKEKDENGKIVKSMMFFTMNGQIVGRAVEGVDNKPVRCNNWEEENFMYYKIYYLKDFVDNFIGIRGMNEWGQASVFYDYYESEYKSVSYRDFKDAPIFRDSLSSLDWQKKPYGYTLTGKFLTRFHYSYKQHDFTNDAENISNFSYPYLHILDKSSCLYKAGFKDNDRIVKFGNWSIGNSFGVLSNEWNTNFNLNKKVKIEVLRPLLNGSVTRISKEVDCTQSSIDLQEYHELALTNEEYKYLTKKTMQK